MTPFLEIAVPLVSRSVMFFVGSGFSKYLTDGKAPSWSELLVDLVKRIDTPKVALFQKLFNTDASRGHSSKYDLYICAQILELEYRRKGEDIRGAVVEVLAERVNPSTVNTGKVTAFAKFFAGYQEINLVTTNYDTLLSEYVLRDRFCRVFIEGSAVPNANLGANVFHLHGSVAKPKSIVLTISDYFRFQHQETYLSRKFYTLLQESTVVILGYSLGDFNLNSIFNEAQVSRAVSLRRSNIYLISRSEVDRTISDFYSYTYGVRVLAPYEVNEVFESLATAAPSAQKLIDQTGNLQAVLDGDRKWTDEYLKLDDSLHRILLQAENIGASVDTDKFRKMLVDVLERKRTFSREDNAWSQYEHLADWLAEVGTRMDVKATGFAQEYLALTDYSFSYMRKELVVGYSWAAFRVWKARFSELRFENQRLIREYCARKFPASSDVNEVLTSA